jgi:hypothetical protein
VSELGGSAIEEAVPLPQVVASYATYLHTRTLAEPEISVAGREAQVSVSSREKTLTLTFRLPQP